MSGGLAWKLKQSSRGFSLVDIAIVLIILGTLLVVAIGIVPHYLHKLSLENDKQALTRADKAVQGFLISHARLPCPDNTGDGVENCTASVGSVPWKTLDFPAASVDDNFLHLRYSAYRNIAAKANLSTLQNSYVPVVPNGATVPTNLNGLDFCQGLVNAQVVAFSALYTSSGTGTAQHNVAYAIAASGFANADGLGNGFDGTHTGTSVKFGANNQPRDYTYDDLLVVRDFSTLFKSLSCEHLIATMDVMSEVYDFADGVRGNAVDGKNNLQQAVIMDAVATVLVALDAVVAGIDLSSAITALGTASGLLSGAIASCFVLVGCAFIPVYSTAVGLAIAAVAAAGVALGLQVAAVISQAVAIVLRTVALNQAVSQVTTATNHASSTGVWVNRMDSHGAVR